MVEQCSRLGVQIRDIFSSFKVLNPKIYQYQPYIDVREQCILRVFRSWHNWRVLRSYIRMNYTNIICRYSEDFSEHADPSGLLWGLSNGTTLRSIYPCRTVYKDPSLLQDLTQDSATLTGWRRTKRSGEGKMITLYCPGIYCLRYRSFPWSTEVFRNYRKFQVIFS